MSTCPDCGEVLQYRNGCVCGWRAPVHKTISPYEDRPGIARAMHPLILQRLTQLGLSQLPAESPAEWARRCQEWLMAKPALRTQLPVAAQAQLTRETEVPDDAPPF